MVWGIVAVAVVVMGLAAVAGTGRLGEMPPPVNDRPKGRVPDGPLDAAFLAELRIPAAAAGYDRRQVDDYLDSLVAEPASHEAREAVFDVVAGGYDMQVVDLVLERAVVAVPEPPSPEWGTGDAGEDEVRNNGVVRVETKD